MIHPISSRLGPGWFKVQIRYFIKSDSRKVFEAEPVLKNPDGGSFISCDFLSLFYRNMWGFILFLFF